VAGACLPGRPRQFARDGGCFSGWIWLVPVFEDLADRHAPSRLHAATADGAARVYTIDELEDDLALPIN